MYVIREDGEILRTDEVINMLKQYEETFGERFLCFNYVDFPSTKTKIAGEVYRDTLRKALQEGKPCRIVSHRYDIIDH